ncbi:MAG: hypothetical protein O7B99_12365, partial [Planctomycetota bacterium]|nr:hypothetical protein [Planctomycetota bacterium]
DRDALTLWSHAWYAAAADASGKARPKGDARRLVPRDRAALARVAEARALAVEELAKLAETRRRRGKKRSEELVVAWWAERLALELARPAPALLAAHGAELDHELDVPADPHVPVIAALENAIAAAFANGRYGEAIRAARCLRGLARQASFKDLQGPAPDGMDAVERAAADALARARAALERSSSEPWTVAELERLLAEQGESFTREHASFALPGVALTPRGWYRVETDCGFETLLGVAQTIELHHERLAKWYGEDPFVGREGTCRIVPEAYGLEAEGVPFWWAGGFQGGDVTTMRFACGTIEGLGHGLTHELTHRFDGALYPGQMAWLTEGKAVWTGAAYGGAIDTSFVENHALFGTIERAWIKGYGRLANLEQLIEGTIDDYRDNYFAGYALYVYLKTSRDEEGRKLYAEALEPYMAGSRRGNRRPREWFERFFADGKDGRPADLEELAGRFEHFISGFYWQDRKPWTKSYTRGVPDTAKWTKYVYDQPTWVWSRVRAEPAFGEAQARQAGELLAELGREDAATAALVWALAVDGRTPAVERELALLLRELGRKDAAWALEQTLAFPVAAPGAPSPFGKDLRRTSALLAALREAAESCSADGRALAASALAADHDRLAMWLGAEPLAIPRPRASAPLHPFDRPAERLGGWTEDGLTSYEELRVPHLWYAADDGTLHVGRKKPRAGTGQLDRRAHQRHAFTRSDLWLAPGTYKVSCRVQLTTSYVSAAMVIGYARRDRNVRVGFTAGDFLYAIGNKEGAKEIQSVHWSVRGLRTRDGALPGSRPRGTVDFGRPRTAFELELLVEDAAVHVYVNGERRGTYHTVDGAPIEGYVGFATSMGAIRVHDVEVQRLDRSELAARADGRAFELFLNNAFRGGVVPATNGTLVLRMAQPDDEEAGFEFDPEYWIARTVRRGIALGEMVERTGTIQPWVVAVSEKLEDRHVAAIAADIAAERGESPVILRYPHIDPSAPPPEDDPIAEKDLDTNWLVLVDPSGIIRVQEQFFVWSEGFSDKLTHWLAALRDHGWPERTLPPVVREQTGEDGVGG